MAEGRGGDITGLRSGMVVALERTEEKRRGCCLWRCRCDCGRELLLEPYKITGGLIKSCGCQRGAKRIQDITGQRFGKLTALRRLDRRRGSSYLWLCRCDCGREIETTVNALRSGNTRSCGCGRVEAVQRTNQTHGTVADHVHLIDGTCVEKLERKKRQRNNTSGFTGVQARGSRWIAVITFKKRVYYLGMFTRLEDAVRARKQAEEHLHDAFLEWYYATYPDKKEKEQKEPDQSTD